MGGSMALFSKARDRMVERVALVYLNATLLRPYGRAHRLHIDSTTKTIRFEIHLKGETEPVEVEITDYEITREADRYFALVKSIRTSREWLTALATDQVCDRRFDLPEAVGRWLKRTL